MTLFDLAQLIIFILITLIVITGSILAKAFVEGIIITIVKIVKNKKAFDKQHPVGDIFATRIKQEFPYGKWQLQGKDQNGFYLYERTK